MRLLADTITEAHWQEWALKKLGNGDTPRRIKITITVE